MAAPLPTWLLTGLLLGGVSPTNGVAAERGDVGARSVTSAPAADVPQAALAAQDAPARAEAQAHSPGVPVPGPSLDRGSRPDAALALGQSHRSAPLDYLAHRRLPRLGEDVEDH